MVGARGLLPRPDNTERVCVVVHMAHVERARCHLQNTNIYSLPTTHPAQATTSPSCSLARCGVTGLSFGDSGARVSCRHTVQYIQAEEAIFCAVVAPAPRFVGTGTRSPRASPPMASEPERRDGSSHSPPRRGTSVSAAAEAAAQGDTALVDKVLQSLTEEDPAARATVLAAALCAAAEAGNAAMVKHLCDLQRDTARPEVGGDGPGVIAGLHDAMQAAAQNGFTAVVTLLAEAARTREAVVAAGVDVAEGELRGAGGSMRCCAVGCALPAYSCACVLAVW